MKKEKINHGERAHSKIGASSMDRWAHCPGSVALCETIPAKASSSYAAEGTKAHELAEAILQRELMGKSTKAGLELIATAPDEMRDAVQIYVDWVLEHPATAKHIEHRFDLSSLYAGLFGTADFVGFDPTTSKLTIADYKHGAGVMVSPERNSQMMYYALGALMTLGYKADTVEIVVVQPRCTFAGDPGQLIRSWSLPAFELLDFAADLIEAAKATESPNAPLVSGNHCRFCPASGVCPKLESQALEAAKTEFSKENKIVPYSPERLAQVLALLPEIEAWAKSVREFAYSEAVAGRVPAGFKLVDKRATRQWVAETDAKEALLMLGFEEGDILETPSLKSPAQIEKIIKGSKEAKAAILSPLVKQVSTGTTLVPDDDNRREAVGIDAAKRDFGAIK